MPLVSEARNHIAYIHKQIPHTDPLSDEGKRPENSNLHLKLWQPNTYPDLADHYLTLIESKIEELGSDEQEVLKWRLNTRLTELKKLEHHFRLQNVIAQREKKLSKDFPSDLLRI